MIPFGLDAAACSMIRAMSAKSPVGGFLYSTSTSICFPAVRYRSLWYSTSCLSQEHETLTRTARQRRSPIFLLMRRPQEAEATSRLLKHLLHGLSPIFIRLGRAHV